VTGRIPSLCRSPPARPAEDRESEPEQPGPKPESRSRSGGHTGAQFAGRTGQPYRLWAFRIRRAKAGPRRTRSARADPGNIPPGSGLTSRLVPHPRPLTLADGWRPALGFALEASGSSPRCWDSLRNLPLAPRLPAAHRERRKPGRNATRLRILPWQFRALLAAAAPGNTGDQTAVEPARNICAEASRAGSPPRNRRKTMKAIKARALGACESWVTWPSGCRRVPDRQSKGLYSEDLGPGWPLPCKSSALTSCRGGPVQAGTKRARRAARSGR